MKGGRAVVQTYVQEIPGLRSSLHYLHLLQDAAEKITETIRNSQQ